MNEITFDSEVDADDIKFEDGKQAKIVTMYGPGEDDSGVFIRFQSWCEGGSDHPEFDGLITVGHKYRVTITDLG